MAGGAEEGTDYWSAGSTGQRIQDLLDRYSGAINPSKPEESDDDREDSAASQRLADRAKENRDGRARYAPRLFWLTVIWLLVVLILVVFAAFRITLWGSEFSLSDAVLVTLIGSTTATVIGLFAIVARHYFPGGSDTNGDT